MKRLFVAVCLLIAYLPGSVPALERFAMIPSSSRPQKSDPAPPQKDLAEAYNRFGLDLLRLQAGGDETVFISPASIALCLALANNGAAGTTAAEISAALGTPDVDIDAFNSANRTLLGRLAEIDPEIRLDIANSLWLKEAFPFREAFIARCRESYDAGVFPLTGAAAINAWVKEKTQEMIPSIIESIDPLDIAVLVNAIYFKGSWRDEFDPAQTRDGVFHAAGSERTVPMMSRSGDFAYLENELLQAVRLPYGDESGAAMYVLLPREGKELGALRDTLSLEQWSKWRGELRTRAGYLELPRFKASYFANLNQPLTELGIREAFGRKADFSRLCRCARGEVFISDVLHKAVIEVNEEGTEAAAATSITLRLTAAMPTVEPFRMIVERPFLLAIIEEETGLILFIGSITDMEE